MRAMKMVSDIGWGQGRYTDKLAKLKWTTLEERRWRVDMIQTWRIIKYIVVALDIMYTVGN